MQYNEYCNILGETVANVSFKNGKFMNIFQV